MLLSPDGWIQHPDFTRIDGIADKVYSQPNSGLGGIACHSIVGEEPDSQDGVPNRFLSTARTGDGEYTKNAAASCMFIIRKRAKHVQMYPVTASTWTTGGREANTTTWPIEAEGGRSGNESEPLTRHQEDAFVTIATAWEQRFGRTLEVGQTVRSHGAIARLFGYEATACESGRYKKAWSRLTAGERYVAETGTVAAQNVEPLNMPEGAPLITEQFLRRLIREEIASALDIDNNLDVRLIHFRKLLNLAINGGPGAFADSQGNPLPLIRDRDLLVRLEALER
jgi:hypothetical protein